jgi:hypothetical protein
MVQLSRGLLIGLRLIAYEIDSGWAERVHKAIEKEIARGQQRVEKSRESGNTEAFETIVDDECDQIEELLGIAFVACQAYVNRVWKQVKDLNKACELEYGKPMPSLANRQMTLRVEGSKLTGSSITNIEAIYAVGNFWKHSEEWPTRELVAGGRRKDVWDTSKMQPIQRATAEVVSEIGLRIGLTGNLRTAARVLGVSDYKDLGAIRKPLNSWAKRLLEVARMDVDRLARESVKQQDAVKQP